MATGTATGGTVATSRGIGWALLAALLFGIFLATYAGAAADSSAGALLWSRVALVASTGLGVLALRAPLRVRPRDGALVLVPGLLLALGTFAFGEASRMGLLSVVSVIATLNPVVTVVLAFLLLRERPGGLQRARGRRGARRGRAARGRLSAPLRRPARGWRGRSHRARGSRGRQAGRRPGSTACGPHGG